MAIRTYIWKKPAPPAIRIPKLRNKPMPPARKIQKFPNKPIRLAIKFRKVRSRPRPARVRTKTDKQRPPQRTKSRPRKRKLRQINLTAITKSGEQGRGAKSLQVSPQRRIMRSMTRETPDER